jgi:cytochrome c biogenesis protein CcmG, thiol:disulfide interchange protein DsbE
MTDPSPPRRSPWVFLLPLGFLALIGVFGWYGLFGNRAEKMPSGLIGSSVPGVVLAPLDERGQSLSTAGIRGPAIVNFYASWCGPCKAEHPLIIETARSAGVKWIGIAYRDDAGATRKYLNELGDPYVGTWRDPEGAAGVAFGIIGVPETFVIDRNGVIRAVHRGPLTAEAMQRKLLPMYQGLVTEAAG